jgi:hypothetical protein
MQVRCGLLWWITNTLGDTNYHIGNSRFRHFCRSYKKKYKTASKEGRQAVVQEIVDDWRSQNPPGRFLARTNPTDKEISMWHDVGDEASELNLLAC